MQLLLLNLFPVCVSPRHLQKRSTALALATLHRHFGVVDVLLGAGAKVCLQIKCLFKQGAAKAFDCSQALLWAPSA